MPTGYTCKVGDGQAFDDFVWGCAKAFGAFINQRDDANDAPPVLIEKPSDYYAKQVADAIAEQRKMDGWTDAQWRDDWETYRARTTKESEERATRYAALADKYNAMLVKVRDWTPPTSDHESFKAFMIQQLEESLKHDCTTWEQEVMPFNEWKRFRIEHAAKDIQYYTKDRDAEAQRVSERNAWKAALLQSVPLPTSTKA